DPVLLGVAADHEPIDVLHEQDRHPRLVAIHDETGSLVGGVDVEDAAELHGALGRLHALPLIGDDANGPAAEPTGAADERLAELGFVLVERSIVEDELEEIADVVLAALSEGEKPADSYRRALGSLLIRRKRVNQPPQPLQTLLIVRLAEVDRP